MKNSARLATGAVIVAAAMMAGRELGKNPAALSPEITAVPVDSLTPPEPSPSAPPARAPAAVPAVPAPNLSTPAAELDALRAQWPRQLQNDLQVKEIQHSGNYVRVIFEYRGLRVEKSDLSLALENGHYHLAQGALPALRDTAATFPAFGADAILRDAQSAAQTAGFPLTNSQIRDTSWRVSSAGELIPCVNVNVSYMNGKLIKDERWCVNAATGEVDHRHPTTIKY